MESESDNFNTSLQFNTKFSSIRGIDGDKECCRFINFEDPRKEIKPCLNPTNFNLIGFYMNDTINTAIEKVTDEINEKTLFHLVFDPSSYLKGFVEFLHSKVPIKVRIGVALIWPPVNPTKSPHVRSVFAILTELVRKSIEPEKTIAWIACAFEENKWFTGETKRDLLAYSQIDSEDKKPKVAILDDKKTLFVYLIDGKGLKCIFKERTIQAKFQKETNQLSFIGITGKEIAKMRLIHSHETKLWIAAYSKNPPNAVEFYGGLQDHVPSIMFKGMYSAIIQPDMLLVRVLLSPGFLPDQVFEEIFSALFEISCYAQRTVFFIKTFFAIIFEQPGSDFESLISGKSRLSKALSVIITMTTKKYRESFCRKLGKYIESNPNINPFTEQERYGVVFFTTLKYILHSYDTLPPTFKQICSILAHFTTLKFNNKSYTIRMVLNSVVTITCLHLETMYKKTKIKSYLEMHKMARSAFNFKRLPPKYNIGDWGKRLEKHFKPRATLFAMNIINYHENLQWPIPGTDYIAEDVQKIIKVVTINHKDVLKTMNDIMNKIKFTTSGYGWSIATYVLRCFEENNNAFNSSPDYPALHSIAPAIISANKGRQYAALVDKKAADKYNNLDLSLNSESSSESEVENSPISDQDQHEQMDRVWDKFKLKVNLDDNTEENSMCKKIFVVSSSEDEDDDEQNSFSASMASGGTEQDNSESKNVESPSKDEQASENSSSVKSIKQVRIADASTPKKVIQRPIPMPPYNNVFNKMQATKMLTDDDISDESDDEQIDTDNKEPDAIMDEKATKLSYFKLPLSDYEQEDEEKRPAHFVDSSADDEEEEFEKITPNMIRDQSSLQFSVKSIKEDNNDDDFEEDTSDAEQPLKEDSSKEQEKAVTEEEEEEQEIAVGEVLEDVKNAEQETIIVEIPGAIKEEEEEEEKKEMTVVNKEEETTVVEDKIDTKEEESTSTEVTAEEIKKESSSSDMSSLTSDDEDSSSLSGTISVSSSNSSTKDTEGL